MIKTVEEKAKAYDKAKYIMKEYLESGNAGVIAENTIKKAFPELRESEDERIRKKLLEYFKSFTSETFFNGVPTSDAIAWLEKQGGNTYNKELSELLHKVICRFINDPDIPYSDREKVSMEVLPYVERLEKQGNANKEYWRGYREGKQEILDKYAELEKQGEQKPDTNCLLSWSEMDEKMLQSLEGIVKDYWAKAEQEKNEIKIREASNVSYFLKTIQKSPLCWIKCSDELPNRDGIYLVVTDGRHNDVYDMARYDSIEGWHKASEIIYWMPIPQLNNKSIIEQKPADNIEKPWSEDDNKHLERILKELKNQWQRPSNRPYLDEIVSDYYWLNSLKDRVQPQPKQGWSEVDEDMRYKAKAVINRLCAEGKEYVWSVKTLKKLFYWLNSLKDRVQPQSKWSEEDEARFKSCIKVLQTSDGYDTINAKWLKSLRHQNTWKPSEEQMMAIDTAINVLGKGTLSGKHLIELQEQLKNLRME